MSHRRYASPLRRAEAARTRSAILDAATTLFGRDGYAATTMKAIAEEAGVSVQSVHLAGSKSMLLISAFERTFVGDGRESDADPGSTVADLAARADADDALSGWLDRVARANTRSAGLARAMAVAGESDDAAAQALADLDARRRREVRLAAAWMIDRELLRSSDVDEVADELDHLVGPETYAFFVTRSGWTVPRYRAWLERALRAHLVREAGDPPLV